MAGIALLLAVNGFPTQFPKPSGAFAVGRTRFDWVELRADTLATRPGVCRQLVAWLWYRSSAHGDARRLSAAGMAGSTREPCGHPHDRLSDAGPIEGSYSRSGQCPSCFHPNAFPGRIAARRKRRPRHLLYGSGRRSGEPRLSLRRLAHCEDEDSGGATRDDRRKGTTGRYRGSTEEPCVRRAAVGASQHCPGRASSRCRLPLPSGSQRMPASASARRWVCPRSESKSPRKCLKLQQVQ